MTCPGWYLPCIWYSRCGTSRGLTATTATSLPTSASAGSSVTAQPVRSASSRRRSSRRTAMEISPVSHPARRRPEARASPMAPAPRMATVECIRAVYEGRTERPAQPCLRYRGTIRMADVPLGERPAFPFVIEVDHEKVRIGPVVDIPGYPGHNGSPALDQDGAILDRKSTRLNSRH